MIAPIMSYNTHTNVSSDYVQKHKKSVHNKYSKKTQKQRLLLLAIGLCLAVGTEAMEVRKPELRSFFQEKLKADGNIIDAGLANDQDFITLCVSKMTNVYEAKKKTNVHAFWEKSSKWLGKQIEIRQKQKRPALRKLEEMKMQSDSQWDFGDSGPFVPKIDQLQPQIMGEWPTNKDGYTDIHYLGKGAFGQVYRAYCPAKKTNVAIKMMTLDSAAQAEEYIKEVAMQKSLKHKNLLGLHCSFADEETKELWVVFPLCEGGSLNDVLRDGGNKGIDDKNVVATILKQVLEGLAYFHKQFYIHRDIKADNILLAADGTVKLIDYGVSGAKFENGRLQRRATFTGTPCWMAPEVLVQQSDKGYDERVDIWSFGITALEIAFGRPPFSDEPPMRVMLDVLKRKPLDEWIKEKFASKGRSLFSSNQKLRFGKSNFEDLVGQCLQTRRSDRPSVAELLKHKFFEKHARDAEWLRENFINRPVSEGGAGAEF